MRAAAPRLGVNLPATAPLSSGEIIDPFLVSFQLSADPCASNPCHHGNCSSGGSGYICVCSEGYEGPNCERPLPGLPESGWTEFVAPRELPPVPATQEPDVTLPRSQATATLPTWQPKTGQKVIEMKWDQVEVIPDVACGNASSNSSAGGRLVSFAVPQNTSVKILQDATASLILLWKVTATGFQQCSLIDGRSVTPLQAPGGLVLLEEMLSLGQNHFIGLHLDTLLRVTFPGSCQLPLSFTLHGAQFRLELDSCSQLLPQSLFHLTASVQGHKFKLRILQPRAALGALSQIASFIVRCQALCVAAVCVQALFKQALGPLLLVEIDIESEVKIDEEFHLCILWEPPKISKAVKVNFHVPPMGIRELTLKKGFVNDSVTKSIVALRLTLVVKASTCVPGDGRTNDLECSGKGKCTTKPSEATFSCTCEDQYMGTFCEEFDACHRKPCKNEASCIDANEKQEGNNFTCLCLPGYTGELCQSKIDYCVLDPCRNGATCISSLSGFTCQCPEGYFGSACEEKVDPCASSPCQNNGTCYVDGVHFTCSCSPGFTGPTCADLVDFCALSPCAHGTCRSVGTSYKCLCDPGYHGLYCEEEYNECLSTPCLNAATCRDLVNGYECVCLADYKGIHCELYKDPCANVSCLNGGACDSESLNGTCVCAPGFTGKPLCLPPHHHHGADHTQAASLTLGTHWVTGAVGLSRAGEECDIDINECDSSPCHHAGTCLDQPNGYACRCPHGWVGANCEIHLQWKSGHMAESLTNMPRHSLYIIIGALCVAFVLMLIILIVGICRISRIEYQGSSRPAYEEFYNCRSIDGEFSSALASLRHARFGKKSRPAMYDATPIAYEGYSPDDKPLVTLIKTKDL
ncbi:Delta and Notch-like epidermal growth factor-related receptor [Fukomys damarensis]|uniref:Delta and Notch-like epidermal growth factor-related receptor n=1 Tax=Fukomys damarensis TaxID=885580 RepID=A0A091CRM0_FUKDA|nr:Delta and Notch-like epidermal growth factor-related receptor [Fukomys damarensis]